MIKLYSKALWVFFCSVGFSALTFGQSITGSVLDENSIPMPGVTVRIDGTTNGAATDLNGVYTITNAPVGLQNIVFTFIGYKSFTVSVNVPATGSVKADHKMELDAEALAEYVVVGYGVQRQREVTGSISKVDGKQITDIPAPSFEAALQGKAAGVQVTQGSGLAGSGSVVRVRGIASISAAGDPLYVIDGIPITQDYFLNGNRGAFNNNPLASINPNDIASIEILKDAAATGIYGSRGANGVILITTKTGSGTGWSFDLGTRHGISLPTARPDMLNSNELLQIYQEAWENDGNVGLAPLFGGITWDQARQTDTDWVDETIGVGFKQAYNFSAKYATKKFKLFSSIGYDDNGTYLLGNSYERTSVRANAEYEISKKVSITATTSLSSGINNRVDAAWSGGLGAAMSTALPYYPIFYGDTVFNSSGVATRLPGDYYDLGTNPVRQRELQDWKTRELRSISSLAVDIKPIKNMFVKVYGGLDLMSLKDERFIPQLLRNGDRTNVNNPNLIEIYPTLTNNWNTNATVTYLHDLTDKHKLTYLVGFEYQQSRSRSLNRVWREGDDQTADFGGYNNGLLLDYFDTFFDEDFLNDPENAERPRDTLPGFNVDGSNLQVFNFVSGFARVNYAYNDKYFAQASFRADGSSRFGENNRFGYFPSVSAGWVISEEDFLKGSEIISFMKIRAGWGITGNASIPNYQQYGEYQVRENGYNDETFRFLASPPNPNLQWETSNAIDISLETGFFNDRITTTLSFYNKSTTDVLLRITPQPSTGFENFWDNVGKIVNRGIEFQLTSTNMQRERFLWKTDFNIAYNYNEIVSIGDYSPDAISGGTNDTRVVVGAPVGTNFLVEFSHVDPETGRNVYLDINGNETMVWDPANRRAVGRVLPKAVGGITNTFDIGKWTIGLVMIYSFGSDIYDSSSKRQLGVVSEWNMRSEITDRWRQTGDNARYAQGSLLPENYGLDNAFNNNSTQFLDDGDYVRLRRLSVGYNFSKFSIGSMPFEGLNITVSAVNFLTFTNFDGLDPEIARDFEDATDRNMSPNITFLTPPQEMSFNLALNLRF